MLERMRSGPCALSLPSPHWHAVPRRAAPAAAVQPTKRELRRAMRQRLVSLRTCRPSFSRCMATGSSTRLQGTREAAAGEPGRVGSAHSRPVAHGAGGKRLMTKALPRRGASKQHRVESGALPFSLLPSASANGPRILCWVHGSMALMLAAPRPLPAKLALGCLEACPQGPCTVIPT